MAAEPASWAALPASMAAIAAASIAWLVASRDAETIVCTCLCGKLVRRRVLDGLRDKCFQVAASDCAGLGGLDRSLDHSIDLGDINTLRR